MKDNNKILVVFDMDGTLYKSETSFFKAVKLFLHRHSLPQVREDFLRGFIGATMNDFKIWFESLKIDQPIEKTVKEFDDLELECVKSTGQLYENAVEVIRELKEKSSVIGICSNGQDWYVNAILEKFRLTKYIDHVKTPDLKGESKAVMLKELMNAVRPISAFMVGDRFYDINGAREAGFISIGANYGYGGKEMLEADHRIDSLAELGELISRLA